MLKKWVKELIPLAKDKTRGGKIGKIGLSNHNLAEIKEAQEILSKEGLKISAIQNHYSLLNRSSETSGILDYILPVKDNVKNLIHKNIQGGA